MTSLRIHHGADAPTPPASDPEGEYYGPTPAGLQRDATVSRGAVALYGVITRIMVQDREPIYCMRTVKEIGRENGGLSERQTRHLLAELERHGYIARERVFSRKGSPQGVRPLVRLRTPKMDASNRRKSAGDPADFSRIPGGSPPDTRRNPAAPLKRKGDKEIIQFAGTSHGAKKGPATAPQGTPEDRPATPEECAIAEAFKAQIATLTRRLPSPETPGARKRPGDVRQDSPGARSSASPGIQKPTTQATAEATPDDNLRGDC